MSGPSLVAEAGAQLPLCGPVFSLLPPSPTSAPTMSCLLLVYGMHTISFILLCLKMRCMCVNNLAFPLLTHFLLWLGSERNTKTGEPTPRTNLSCHDSSLWEPEMFRSPAKQNCWMWTFGWKIKRLRGMQKGRTSHIPSSQGIQSNSSDSLTTALWALD